MPKLAAHVAGTVTRIGKDPGDPAAPGEAVVILEPMRMPVEAEAAGRGQSVGEGNVRAVIA